MQYPHQVTVILYTPLSLGVCFICGQVHWPAWHLLCQTHEGICDTLSASMSLADVFLYQMMLTVILSCIETSGYKETRETQRHALKALEALITHAWPRWAYLTMLDSFSETIVVILLCRIPSHKDAIMKCLVRAVSDLCLSSSELPQDKGLSLTILSFN